MSEMEWREYALCFECLKVFSFIFLFLIHTLTPIPFLLVWWTKAIPKVSRKFGAYVKCKYTHTHTHTWNSNIWTNVAPSEANKMNYEAESFMLNLQRAAKIQARYEIFMFPIRNTYIYVQFQVERDWGEERERAKVSINM